MRTCRRMAILVLLGACVQVEDPGPIVVLPPEAYRYERFLASPSTLTADRVTIEAVRAYRAEVVPVVDDDYHSKEVTPDRIRLVNLDARFPQNPVSLTFRNLRVQARERIDVVFSDKPLLEETEEPPIVVIVAEGIARLRGDGEDVTAEKIVIRNDRVRAYLADGRRVDGAGP